MLVPPPPRRVPGTVLAVAAATVLVAVVVAVVRPALPDGVTPAPARPSAAASPTPQESPPEEERDERIASRKGIRAVLEVSVRSWVQVTTDGEVAMESVLEEGASEDFEADEVLEVSLGNAGGVRLEVNGREVTTGAPGDVTTLTFEWEDGRLIRG